MDDKILHRSSRQNRWRVSVQACCFATCPEMNLGATATRYRANQRTRNRLRGDTAAALLSGSSSSIPFPLVRRGRPGSGQSRRRAVAACKVCSAAHDRAERSKARGRALSVGLHILCPETCRRPRDGTH